MKRRYLVLFVLIGIALVITMIVIGILLARDSNKPEYKYLDCDYGVGSSLIIDNTVYVEILKDDFDILTEKLKNKGIEQEVDKFIIKIEYPNVDEKWEYKIYGNKDMETRILLMGVDDSIWDTNRPDFFFCRLDVLYSYLDLTDYKYDGNGDSIIGEKVDYIEIDKSTFEAILNELRDQNVYGFAYRQIGKISYNFEEEWKLILYGQLEQEERILLRGKERYAFYDENYPEVYYCREDIFSLFEENDGSFTNVDLYEYINQSN